MSRSRGFLMGLCAERQCCIFVYIVHVLFWKETIQKKRDYLTSVNHVIGWRKANEREETGGCVC